jgi:hypothetical protein
MKKRKERERQGSKKEKADIERITVLIAFKRLEIVDKERLRNWVFIRAILAGGRRLLRVSLKMG